MSEWVSVKKGLPEEGRYLVTVDVYGERYVVETYFHKDRWMTNDRVVAWMPRPEPWEGEKGM